MVPCPRSLLCSIVCQYQQLGSLTQILRWRPKTARMVRAWLTLYVLPCKGVPRNILTIGKQWSEIYLYMVVTWWSLGPL